MENKKKQTNLSWILDDWFELPGGYRIGLDGLLGLIPGVGDAVGGLLSTILLFQAHQAGAPKRLLLKMMWNIIIDSGVGSIPILGDYFDFVWKANRKNNDLLNEFLQKKHQTFNQSEFS